MRPVAWPHDLPSALSYRLEDPEAVAPPGNGWEGGLRQLDRGRLGYRGRKVRLPGAYILWHEYQGRVLARWYYSGTGLCLLLPLAGDGPMKYRGVDLTDQSVVWLHPGREHACVTSRNTRGIEISLASEVVAAWAPPIQPTAVARATSRAVDRLVEVCRRITHAAARNPGALGDARGFVARQHLTNEVRRVLTPDSEGQVTSVGRGVTTGFRIVEQACARMLASPTAAEVDVAETAHALGIGERTLYKAFTEWLGVSPYEYQRIERLHALRKALDRASTQRGSIRAAARTVGLPEGGRLAQVYRRHFAETPRATLKRWSREGSAFDTWPAQLRA